MKDIYGCCIEEDDLFIRIDDVKSGKQMLIAKDQIVRCEVKNDIL